MQITENLSIVFVICIPHLREHANIILYDIYISTNQVRMQQGRNAAHVT